MGVPFYAFRSIALAFLRDVDFAAPSPHAGEWADSHVAGVTSAPAGFVEPGQAVLTGLVDSQRQLTEAVGRLIQQQAETNSQLRHLTELIEKKGSQARGAPRCNFCKRVGHTIDKCYQRMNKDKNAPQPGDSLTSNPQVSENKKSGNQTPPS